MDEQIKEEIKNDKEEYLHLGFFKKVWYSITKIEKYPHMSAQGLAKSIGYLAKIVAILAIILCLGMMYQTNGLIKQGVNYLQNEFPEFSYNEGILDIKTEEAMTIAEENSVVGKTIIDTKAEDEQVVNKYINSIQESGSGLIILKDRIILKNESVAGTITYNYKETFSQMGITQFNKQDVINYANSNQIINVYVSVFVTIFIYGFVMYLLTTLSNVILLSIFGYITTWIAKIKMRYVAIFNMSVYALTLSIILNMIYMAVNFFITFEMEYFQVMYTAVAAIYLVAAIFILKSEFIKKQAELIKIAEAQAIVKKELEQEEEENKKQERKEQEEKQKQKEKEKKEDEEKETTKNQNNENNKNKKKDKRKDNTEGEPEGSNA